MLLKSAEQVTIAVGDKVYHNGILCEITEIASNSVYIKTPKGIIHIMGVEELNGKSFEYVVEFSKNGNLFGKSHTPTLEKAEKEKALLSELGWDLKTYRQERK